MSEHDIHEYSRRVYGMVDPPDRYLEVPCGWCNSCQKSQNNQYRIRLMFEIRKYPPDSCLFVTLTFDDENLKRFEKDTNKAVRLFLDRLRKNYGKQIRHWFVGEYGSLRGRPHYHGILFGVPRRFIDAYDPDVPGCNPLISKEWKYGFTFTGYVSDETCSYITKYLTKSINGQKRRPRVITSFGIGDNYLQSEEATLHKLPDGSFQPFVILNGFKQAMPRYYYNKLFSDSDKASMVLDRYYNPPPFSWQGVDYPTEAARNAARAVTLSQNRSLGLTINAVPPDRRRLSAIERYKLLLEDMDKNNEFSLWLNTEYPRTTKTT